MMVINQSTMIKSIFFFSANRVQFLIVTFTNNVFFCQSCAVFDGYFYKQCVFQPIVNGTFSVDSFFVLSGLLTSYLFFKRNGEKKESHLQNLKTVSLIFVSLLALSCRQRAQRDQWPFYDVDFLSPLCRLGGCIFIAISAWLLLWAFSWVLACFYLFTWLLALSAPIRITSKIPATNTGNVIRVEIAKFFGFWDDNSSARGGTTTLLIAPLSLLFMLGLLWSFARLLYSQLLLRSRDKGISLWLEYVNFT